MRSKIFFSFKINEFDIKIFNSNCVYVNSKRSLLSRTEVEELSQAELDSLDEIVLNKPMLPENFSFEALKMHVLSITCFHGQEDVS